jgi:molybdenum cofactor cytidylyltransferase
MAAGGSSRFGNETKQLAQLHQELLINRAINNFTTDGQLLPNIEKLTVVLGCKAKEIASYLAPIKNMDVLYFEDWRQGLGSSIAYALQQLDKTEAKPISHVLIGLADQIELTPNCYLDLLSVSKRFPDKIAVASYSEQIGVPAIFPHRFIRELKRISGDTGAKPLLQKHVLQLERVSMSRAAIDIDTKEELTKWLSKNHK